VAEASQWQHACERGAGGKQSLRFAVSDSRATCRHERNCAATRVWRMEAEERAANIVHVE
jgi:hypothetical protein